MCQCYNTISARFELERGGAEITVTNLLTDLLDTCAFSVIHKKVESRACIGGHGTSRRFERYLFYLINRQGKIALGISGCFLRQR